MDLSTHLVQPGVDHLRGARSGFRRVGASSAAGGALAVAVVLLCAFSLLIKHNTLFWWWAAFVAFWGWRKAALRLIAAMSLWGLSFAHYIPAGLDAIIERVLLYSSWHGRYGLQIVLSRGLMAVLLYLAMMALPLMLRSRGLSTILMAQLSAFFVLTHGYAPNLAAGFIVIAMVLNWRWGMVISLAAFPGMWHELALPSNYAVMNLVWVAATCLFVILMAREVRRASLDRGIQSA
jgi:hypothetical protein